MNNRMSRCAALIGTVLSLSSFAQDCQELSLYKNGSESGKMETAGNTFPEPPEWNANWGEMDGMQPPYIRLSGMKQSQGDWTGTLSFQALPTSIQGGTLSLKVRSTQKGKFGVWLYGDFGTSPISFQNVEANTTTAINVSIANLIGNKNVLVNKIGFGIFDVPSYQYTTLFLDDIALSCASNRNNELAATDAVTETAPEYVYDNLQPSNPKRPGKFLDEPAPETSPAYTQEERRRIADSTSQQIVVSEQEHQQIIRHAKATSVTPKQSRDRWFRNMYFMDRNRLRDSVIANPKGLFYEAETYAAATGNQAMPILIGNVDYGYRACRDSSCSNTSIQNSRLLQASLPTASVSGSIITIHYDPYFVSTNRKNLPVVEIFTDRSWKILEPNTKLDIEFESAGIQKLQIRLTEGGLTVNQNLFVEVK